MGRQFLELLGFIVTVGVLPIVMNKSTEHGRLDWIHPHLRIIWTAIVGFYSCYLLAQPFAQSILIQMHLNLRPAIAYPILAALGAGLFCAFYWSAGKIFDSQSATQAQTEVSATTPSPLTTPSEQEPTSLSSPIANQQPLTAPTKSEGTRATKPESRLQPPDQNLKQPSTVNQTMTNSPAGIQAGGNVTVGEKPSTATPTPDKDKKP